MSDFQYDLSQLQHWMQSVITHFGGIEAGIESDDARQVMDVTTGDVEQVVNRSQACTSVDRLRVYGNAYYARLVECLRESFPCMVFAIGEETFDQFAFGYLQRYPSTSYTLSKLGDQFAKYLEETRPASVGDGEADWPDFLIDLANLEWNIEQVFDGPGFEGQTPFAHEQLRNMTAEDWPNATLQPAACLRLLEYGFPVNRYYTEYREGRKVPFPPPRAEYVALTRRDYVVRRIELSQPQYQLLRLLCGGSPVGDAICQVAESGNEDIDRMASEIRTWFQDWARAGLFCGLHLGS